MASLNSWIRWTWRSALLAMLLCMASLARAETPLVKGLCDPGKEQSGWLCYPECRSTHTGVGPVCWEKCPAGFVDYGVGCSDLKSYAKDTYGRGAGTPLSCSQDREKDGALCYPHCRDGYNGIGPVCWGRCPAGTDVDFGALCTRWPRFVGWVGWGPFRYPKFQKGWTRFKPSYGRGAGTPLTTCPDSREKDGALCYPNCRDGYSGVGPVCWAKCRDGFNDDGAFCRRDNGFTKHSYGRGVGEPLSLCPNYDRNTHYPIVFVHGWMGYDTVFDFGIKWSPIKSDYWVGVLPALRSGSRGARHVYRLSISTTGTNESRGEQVMSAVKRILAETGRERVHLIGHSQGAPTARYVAGVAPELVASVTSVAGVNHSPALLDWVMSLDPAGRDNYPEYMLAKPFADFFAMSVNILAYGKANPDDYDNTRPGLAMASKGMQLFNWVYPWGLTDLRKGKGENWESPLAFVSKPMTLAGEPYENYYKAMKDGSKSNFREMLKKFALSSENYKDDVVYHKEQYPVLYYSWAGIPPFTGNFGLDGYWWPTAASFAITDRITRNHMGAKPGDGAVDGDAARLGKMVGKYNLDHVMISNSLQSSLPISHLFGKAHPISLFCEHANRLVEAEKDILRLSPDGQANYRFSGITVNRYGQAFDAASKPIRAVPTTSP